jgi:hypothetical protein
VTSTQLGTIGLFVSAVIATIGFVGFAVLARFWRSRGGWHVFWFMLVIAWILDLNSFYHFFNGDSTYAWLRASSLAFGLPFVLGWRSWIIFDLQLFHRRRRGVAYRDTDSRRPAAEEEKHGA